MKGNKSAHQVFNKSKLVWEDNLKLFPNTKLQYPNENLIRLFSGKYVPIPPPPARLMDHGFGHGNNLVFFTKKGYTCSGCEISQNLIDEVSSLYKAIGEKVDLRLIKGLEIPFLDNSFDIIVSWSAIYFNGTRTAVQKVVDELRRVLKPEGSLLLSTVNPESALFSYCKKIDDESYVVDSDKFSNLKGLTYFFPDSRKSLVRLFSKFAVVKSGNYAFDLCHPLYKMKYYFIYAVK